MATTTTTENDDDDGDGDADYWIRKAVPRNGLESARLSIPSEVVDKLDIVAGDNVVIRIDDDGSVRLEKLSLD